MNSAIAKEPVIMWGLTARGWNIAGCCILLGLSIGFCGVSLYKDANPLRASASDSDVIKAARWVKMEDGRAQNGFAPDYRTPENICPGINGAMAIFRQIKSEIDAGQIPNARRDLEQLRATFPKAHLLWGDESSRYTGYLNSW